MVVAGTPSPVGKRPVSAASTAPSDSNQAGITSATFSIPTGATSYRRAHRYQAAKSTAGIANTHQRDRRDRALSTETAAATVNTTPNSTKQIETISSAQASPSAGPRSRSSASRAPSPAASAPIVWTSNGQISTSQAAPNTHRSSESSSASGSPTRRRARVKNKPTHSITTSTSSTRNAV